MASDERKHETGRVEGALDRQQTQSQQSSVIEQQQQSILNQQALQQPTPQNNAELINQMAEQAANPTQRQEEEHRTSHPQGDSTLVGVGENHVYRNADIAEAALTSLDNTRYIDAGSVFGTVSAQEIALGHTAQADAMWNEVTKDYLYKNDQGVQFVDYNTLIKDLEDNKNLITFKETSDFNNSSLSRLSEKSLDELTKHESAIYRGSYTPDDRSKMVFGNDPAVSRALDKDGTLTFGEADIRGMRAHVKTVERNSQLDAAVTRTMADIRSVSGDIRQLSSERQQEVLTMAYTLHSARKNIDKAEKDLKEAEDKLNEALKPGSHLNKTDARRAVEAAKKNLAAQKNNAHGAFTVAGEEGNNGHYGRTRFRFLDNSKALQGERAGNEVNSFNGKVRRVQNAVRVAETTHAQILSNRAATAERRLNRAANRGVDISKDVRYRELSGRKDAYKSLADAERGHQKALYGNSEEARQQTYKELHRTRKNVRAERHRAKSERKDRRLRDRLERKGNLSSDRIEKTIKDKRIKRDKRANRRERRRDRRDRFSEKLYSLGGWHRRIGDAIRTRIRASAVYQRFINMKIVKAYKAISGFFQGILNALTKFLLAALPVILMVLVLFLTLWFAYMGTLMALQYFIGDDGEHETAEDEDIYTDDYDNLVSDLADVEREYIKEVNRDAKRAAKEEIPEIKKQLGAASLHYYSSDFNPEIRNARLGWIQDEYGNLHTSMGDYIQILLMAKHRVQDNLNSKNEDRIASYVANLFSGQENADSDNWKGRVYDEKDKKKNVGSDIDGNKIKGDIATDGYKFYEKNYSYQNWDDNACHWEGENHQAQVYNAEETMYANKNGTSYGAFKVALKKGWFKNDGQEVALEYWHHNNPGACEIEQFHPTGHVCNHGHWVHVPWPGTDYWVCDGHCPGHVVPRVDYKFVSKIENLAAYDDAQVNQLRSPSERFKAFWQNVGQGLKKVFLKVLSLFTPAAKEGLEAMKEVEDFSGESTWNHWSPGDIDVMNSLAGSYEDEYSHGREFLNDVGIKIPEGIDRMTLVEAEEGYNGGYSGDDNYGNVGNGTYQGLSGNAARRKFIADMLPAIKKACKEMGYTVNPRICMAQLCLESGSGQHESGNYNYYGIKASKAEIKAGKYKECWTHEVINGHTIRIKDKFASYSSPEEGLRKYLSDLARKWPGTKTAQTPTEFVYALKHGTKGAYMTADGGQYARTLASIMKSVPN